MRENKSKEPSEVMVRGSVAIRNALDSLEGFHESLFLALEQTNDRIEALENRIEALEK